jgi:2-desacetyl-2-hydroxyethyl bacteriochlorophyllide A dehydrogenase
LFLLLNLVNYLSLFTRCQKAIYYQSSAFMKRLVWHGGENLRIECSATRPPDPGNDEVLLRVRGVGICGTDIHILNDALPVAKPPMVLGHEISGEIVTAGRNVKNVKPGDRVTVDAVVGCGRCGVCDRNRSQFCAQSFEFGISKDGGCQEYLVLPKKNVYLIPDSMSFEEAAILDMEVYNAVRKCGVASGDHVLVLGAGPIGLIACQVARFLGAGHITLGDIRQGRLDASKALNVAERHLCLQQDQANNGNGALANAFDLVIDCAGTSQSTKYALHAARPSGRLLLYGVYEHDTDDLDLNLIVLKDLVVFGAQSDRDGWEEVIAIVTSGKLNLKGLITHRLSLEEGARAYDLVRKREDAVIKAVFVL